MYVTNTIVYEHELPNAKQLLRHIVKAGVDAILVQDMAVVELMSEIASEPEMKGLRMPELHASTQTDNRTAEKAAWLTSVGFSRVVLARELSLDEIREVHEAVPQTELEVFVHGALCVSYSGACPYIIASDVAPTVANVRSSAVWLSTLRTAEEKPYAVQAICYRLRT